jgi:glycosyltransferase involved in cell wall biosynthesis
MKILWMTWKDLKHPQAGGAEVVNEELAKRLAADGHEVLFLVGGYPGAKQDETAQFKIKNEKLKFREGQPASSKTLNFELLTFRVVRLGNRYTVYYHAWRYYRKHLVGWADLVIDEVNTVPFFAKFYVKERNILLVYMLCRQIWFYQLPLPFSMIGYLLEPIYLRLLRDRQVLTESQSTKDDLLRYGFKADKIHIFSVGIELEPLKDLGDRIEGIGLNAKTPTLNPKPSTLKYPNPTLLSLGAMRTMKRTLHQIQAFELAKLAIPNLKLVIAGDASGRYGQKIVRMTKESPYANDIKYLGKVTREQKLRLMQQCHLILVTSVKEGWGLIVTEAASQGTPAVVYDVDGLRDSVRHNETGIVCRRNTPEEMARALAQLLQNSERYQSMRQEAWLWSREINFDQGYHQFKQALGLGR